MIGADRRRSGPSCVLPKGVPQGQTESGGSTRRHMLGPERPEAVSPDRALYLPTFSHLLIVNKLLSLEEALYLPTFSHLFDCQ